MITVASGFRRLKRIKGYAAHARFLAEVDETPAGEIDRVIHEPYRFGPTHVVDSWNGRLVLILETAHRQYDVFAVPAGYTIRPLDQC